MPVAVADDTDCRLREMSRGMNALAVFFHAGIRWVLAGIVEGVLF